MSDRPHNPPMSFLYLVHRKGEELGDLPRKIPPHE
jgi:hypothetical protein